MRLLLALGLVLSSLWGCASVQHAERTYAMTPEGWVVVYTDNQKEVASACDDADNTLVIGCALWPREQIPPVTECVVYVYTRNDGSESMSSILRHELRHCREGQFHAE